MTTLQELSYADYFWECPECDWRFDGFELDSYYCVQCLEHYGDCVKMQQVPLKCDECEKLSCICKSWKN